MIHPRVHLFDASALEFRLMCHYLGKTNMTSWHLILVTADGCSRTETTLDHPSPSREFYSASVCDVRWEPYPGPIKEHRIGLRRYRLTEVKQASPSHGVAIYREECL